MTPQSGGEELLVFNGLDAASGRYLVPPLPPADVAGIARGEPQDTAHLRELRWWHERLKSLPGTMAPIEGVDISDLAEAGWGVIFAPGLDAAVKDALGPLLAHRRGQATQVRETYYRESTYLPGETKQRFLARSGASAAGPANPANMPYYLLIVGDPESIPYSFQSQLDVQYAVGRIHFDTPDEYAQYARSVVVAEGGAAARPRRAAFFAARNPDDPSTALSADHLVEPLAKWVAAEMPGWEVAVAVGDQATKARLGRLLGGAETPALLFTAGHGVGFPAGDPSQERCQGALACQEWPGPMAWTRPLLAEHYFAGADVPSDAQPHGLITFHFACYGAGTPRTDDFTHLARSEPAAIAARAFVAALPRRLLAHPRGGALAVVGHVDRAWSYSFVSPRSGEQLEAFQSVLKRLMQGYPVGAALDYFNQRYAELSSDLAYALQEIRDGKACDDRELAAMWTANNDARSYVIVGDPAVRLPAEADVGSEPAGGAQPT